MRTQRLLLVFLVAACSKPQPSSGDEADAGPPSPDASSVTDASHADAARMMTPIKHVVVIVKENHTFDNYFGSFPGANGISMITTGSGATIAPPHAPDSTPRDLCHEHSCALTDYNGGAMNGWDQVAGTSENGDNLAYAQYQQADIPNYWQYAATYTLADNFFADVLGPSFPGHTFVLAAQAGWSEDNPPTNNILAPYWGCDQGSAATVEVEDQSTCSDVQVAPCFNIPSVPTVLPAGVDWKFYGTNFYVLPEIWSMFDAIEPIREGSGWSNIVNASTFDGDVDNGTLPAVSWLVDQDLDDEHPDVGSVCAGENWTIENVVRPSQVKRRAQYVKFERGSRRLAAPSRSLYVRVCTEQMLTPGRRRAC